MRTSHRSDRGAITEPQLSEVRGDMETIAERDSLIPTSVLEHGHISLE